MAHAFVRTAADSLFSSFSEGVSHRLHISSCLGSILFLLMLFHTVGKPS